METEHNKLAELSRLLKQQMAGLNFNCGASNSQIVPLLIPGNTEVLRATSALQRRGFAVRAIRVPTVPAGGERIRLSVTANLNLSDIQAFTAALAEIRDTVNV